MFVTFHSIFLLVCYFLLLNLPPSFLLYLLNQYCFSCPNGSPIPLTVCLHLVWAVHSLSIGQPLPFPGCMLATYATGQPLGPMLALSSWQSPAFCQPSFCLFCVILSPVSQSIHFTLLSFVSLSLVFLAACCLHSPLPVTYFWMNFTKHKRVGKEHTLLISTLCVSLLFPVFFVAR